MSDAPDAPDGTEIITLPVAGHRLWCTANELLSQIAYAAMRVATDPENTRPGRSLAFGYDETVGKHYVLFLEGINPRVDA